VSYAQHNEDLLLSRLVGDDLEGGRYVDIGAFDPVEHSVTKLFYDRGWCGVNVEPVHECWQRLVDARPRDVNLEAVVGTVPGIVTFYVLPGTGLSTVVPELAGLWAQRGAVVDPRPVPAMTLAEVMAREPDAHFLKVDVEGAEHDVLLSNDWDRYRPIIILIEALDPVTQQPSYQPSEALLARLGYVVLVDDGLNRFYARSDMGHLRDRL
jgi:FkbM family methyltransferase